LFPFCENVCTSKSPVKVQPEILDILILGELHIVCLDRVLTWFWKQHLQKQKTVMLLCNAELQSVRKGQQ
jgi:hypothetical protein